MLGRMELEEIRRINNLFAQMPYMGHMDLKNIPTGSPEDTLAAIRHNLEVMATKLRVVSDNNRDVAIQLNRHRSAVNGLKELAALAGLTGSDDHAG